jgi:hypothetical protein
VTFALTAGHLRIAISQLAGLEFRGGPLDRGGVVRGLYGAEPPRLVGGHLVEVPVCRAG